MRFRSKDWAADWFCQKVQQGAPIKVVWLVQYNKTERGRPESSAGEQLGTDFFMFLNILDTEAVVFPQIRFSHIPNTSWNTNFSCKILVPSTATDNHMNADGSS